METQTQEIKKTCENCKQDKLLPDFSKFKAGLYERANICKQCRKDKKIELRGEKNICNGCGLEKNATQFIKFIGGDTVKLDYCKACSKQKAAQEKQKKRHEKAENKVKKSKQTNKLNLEDTHHDSEDNDKSNSESLNTEPVNMVKTCTICNQEKSLTEFNKLKNGRYGRTTQCKLCRKEQRKNIKYDRVPDYQIVLCPHCNRQLTADNFNSDKSSINGLQTYCRKCQKLMIDNINNTFDGYMSKLLSLATKDAKKNGLEFNITKEELINIYNRQDGFCAVSNLKMTLNNKHGKGKSFRNVAINRIDQSKGYIKDNVRLVCDIYCLMKLRFTQDELIKMSQSLIQRETLSSK